ncbi:LysR family transcriptional regulator, hydrogen peroxide-inducible genes activator [Saccharicrinis carchari]|uniref:LysR family transcriptional regulator, hydrogen peroxide-inducible genes activator n=1 Tax=Saccharicrinis carchari TaxID=1168039 RepID=A0A521AIQ2_SACCC|nr:hydrogen peroxide-inducible genes activator [Saccharicrinis carchari]SMO34709.1 LysR family transcriptional regulator, hydrogen peroxide-inducible genes activator [Saccharicrinis carchari]
MITLTQLEYVVAVDTYRHFVTASEKCFVSQPTLSMQVKKLEEELGVMIFDRSKQPVVPTHVGKAIVEQARKTLAENKRIYNLVQEFTNRMDGELSIAIIPSLAPYLLPLFVGSFSRMYPTVKIKIVELLSEDIIDQLNKDTVDVGLLVTPLNEKGIREKTIFYERMFLYVNNEHPLAALPKIDSEDMDVEGLWLLSRGHCFRSQVVNLCSFRDKMRDENSIDYESGSLETIKKLVEIEGGYTLLPELSVDDKVRNNKYARIKNIGDSDPLREVSMVYSRNFAKQQLLHVLFDCIRESVPQHLLNKKHGHIVEWRK